MTLEWNEDYATGHAEMDAQHRHLFDLVNRMAPVETADGIKPLLMELFKHTREHFQQEEALIRSNGFPGLAGHINGHNFLLRQLNALSVEVGQERFNKPELMKLMTDWALTHIVEHDIKALSYVAPTA